MADATPTDRQLERLVRASLSLTLEHSLYAVLQQVAETGSAITGARHVAVGIAGTNGQPHESLVTHGEAPPDDAGGLRISVAGPRGVLGHLLLADKADGGTFSEEDRHLAELLAGIAGAAIENARSHEESARLLAEVQLLHRTRERFFAMVNHELRNALAAVHGWAQLLVRRKDPGSLPPAAFEVLDAAEQAVGLINDLLDLSRLDEDRLKPVLRLVDPAALARHAVTRALPGAHAKRMDIRLAAPDGLPPIETDASRVEQILVNLLINATKYAPEESTIEVDLAATETGVTFRVRDEGPGVAAADAEVIFDVYYTTADGEKEGVGLGLPLSRRLARMLGGELTVVPREGAGEFLLALPRARRVA